MLKISIWLLPGAMLILFFVFSPDLHGKEPWAVGMHNQHGIPVEGIISVERDNTLLQKFLNPVGCFYHGKYVVRTALVRGKGNLKGIRNGDQIVVFAHRSILPLMLNVVQVASVLGISRAGAYELVHSEGFPALKIGSRIVVPKDKLREWIDANTAQK